MNKKINGLTAVFLLLLSFSTFSMEVDGKWIMIDGQITPIDINLEEKKFNIYTFGDQGLRIDFRLSKKSEHDYAVGFPSVKQELGLLSVEDGEVVFNTNDRKAKKSNLQKINPIVSDEIKGSWCGNNVTLESESHYFYQQFDGYYEMVTIDIDHEKKTYKKGEKEIFRQRLIDGFILIDYQTEKDIQVPNSELFFYVVSQINATSITYLGRYGDSWFDTRCEMFLPPKVPAGYKVLGG